MEALNDSTHNRALTFNMEGHRSNLPGAQCKLVKACCVYGKSATACLMVGTAATLQECQLLEDKCHALPRSFEGQLREARNCVCKCHALLTSSDAGPFLESTSTCYCASASSTFGLATLLVLYGF